MSSVSEEAAGRSVVYDFQELLFPRKNLPASLYVEGQFEDDEELLPGPVKSPYKLRRGEKLGGNTYFNSCYLDYWRQHTTVEKIGVKSRFLGDICMRVIAVNLDGQQRTLINTELSGSSTSDSEETVIWVYDFSTEDASKSRPGRIFIEITAQTACSVGSISFVTDKAPAREVSLSIGICTFNREADLVHTLGELQQIGKAYRCINRIILVNHGPSFSNIELISCLKDSQIQVIEQPNLGGCGGFNRTMYEAISSSEPSTHHLLMDDDIVIDARIIPRAINFLRYATDAVVLGGHMFDSANPNVLHEAGACLDSFSFSIPAGQYCDMSDPTELSLFDTCHLVDYNAWWFCIIPVSAIREIEFSPPMFIRGDDIEYACRLAKHGYTTISMPGVAVWHESFYTKNNDWLEFYYLRNRLLISTIHSEKTAQPGTLLILGIFMYFLLTHRYLAAEMCFAGMKDFLDGPDKAFSIGADEKHRELQNVGSSIIQPSVLEDVDVGQFKLGPKCARPVSIPKIAIQYIMQFVAVSLFPSRPRPTQIFTRDFLHPGVLDNSAYLLSNDTKGKNYLLYQPNRWQLWKSSLRAFGLAFRYFGKRHSVGSEWKSRIGYYQSKKYWKEVVFQNIDENAG